MLMRDQDRRQAGDALEPVREVARVKQQRRAAEVGEQTGMAEMRQLHDPILLRRGASSVSWRVRGFRVIRLVAALGVAVTVSCGLLDVPAQAHASPATCPPACDRIPDSAWIDPTVIPLFSTYSWPRLSGLAVTASRPRFRFEELCATPPMRGDPRDYAVAAKAAVVNPPGQWQLQVQVVHWRGETWRGGQNADATVASAAIAMRYCQA